MTSVLIRVIDLFTFPICMAGVSLWHG